MEQLVKEEHLVLLGKEMQEKQEVPLKELVLEQELHQVKLTLNQFLQHKVVMLLLKLLMVVMTHIQLSKLLVKKHYQQLMLLLLKKEQQEYQVYQ